MVIALCGVKRCGKDTVADYLVEFYGYKKKKIADPLKHVCKYLFNLDDDQLETDKKDVVDHQLGISPRQIMQFFGTEVMQYKIQEILPNIGRNFWMNKMLYDMGKDKQSNIVIGDMRFLHELEAIKQVYGGTQVIKIINWHASSIADKHESEKEWDQIPADYTIINNGSLLDLYKSVHNVITSIDNL